MSSLDPRLLHTVVILALIAGYLLLVLTGQDGTALLGVLGGYIAGAGAENAVQRRSSRP